MLCTHRHTVGIEAIITSSVINKVLNRLTDISQCHQSKVAWRTSVWKTCFQTEYEVLFQPAFSVEVYFFYLVSPNALAICWRLPRGQQTSVCRQTLSASPLSPFSHHLSPLQGHRLASVRAINCTNDQEQTQTPPLYLRTRQRHLPLIST